MRICTHCKDLIAQGYVNESTNEYWHEECLPEELHHRLDAMTTEELDESDLYYTEWMTSASWEQTNDLAYSMAINYDDLEPDTDYAIQRINETYFVVDTATDIATTYTLDTFQDFIDLIDL